ncbi:hypothetical protein CDV55_107103 [Aspergillus turcosus]|nr:hypothetical protein CDV55_107103 [Aspergillus turcosus]
MLVSFSLPSLALLFSSSIASAYLVPPPGTAAPGTNADCSAWVIAGPGVTCALVLEAYRISEADFEDWNPITTEIGSSCTLIEGFDYCVEVNYVEATTGPVPTPTSTPTTLQTSTVTTTSTTSATGTAISTPSPIQTGMVGDCDKFYLVQSGDTCASVASAAGISLADFYTWNPAVGTTCEYLDLGDYVCIGIPGVTPTTTTVSTTSTATDGVSTPSPIQTGMVSTCDKFYLVQSGDTCASVASAADISLTEFYAWNPAVGSSCSYLDVGDYVCVDILGYTITTTSTTSGGISTPSPIQTGMLLQPAFP